MKKRSEGGKMHERQFLYSKSEVACSNRSNARVQPSKEQKLFYQGTAVRTQPRRQWSAPDVHWSIFLGVEPYSYSSSLGRLGQRGWAKHEGSYWLCLQKNRIWATRPVAQPLNVLEGFFWKEMKMKDCVPFLNQSHLSHILYSHPPCLKFQHRSRRQSTTRQFM